MNSVSRILPSFTKATQTASEGKVPDAKITQVPGNQEVQNLVGKRSPENPQHVPLEKWSITSRNDGAVLAIATGISNGEGYNHSITVTLAPPASQTAGAKTIVLQNFAIYGAPEFKLTPFIYGTQDLDRMAFGNASYPIDTVPAPEGLPVVAALRFNTEYVSGHALDGKSPLLEMKNYTMVVFDAVKTLDSGWNKFSTFPAPTATSIDSVPTMSASSSLLSSSAATLSAGQSKMTQPMIAGIAGGLGSMALLAGVGAAYLMRRSAVAKRAAKTEGFALKVLPSLNKAEFSNA